MNTLNIVAVTAFVNQESINMCYEVGIADVIHKPVSVDAIKQILDKYCGNSSDQWQAKRDLYLA